MSKKSSYICQLSWQFEDTKGGLEVSVKLLMFYVDQPYLQYRTTLSLCYISHSIGVLFVWTGNMVHTGSSLQLYRPQANQRTGVPTYTSTHRNINVNINKIKHTGVYYLYWYFQQNQCLNIKKTCCSQHSQISMGPLCSWGPVATAQCAHALGSQPTCYVNIDIMTWATNLGFDVYFWYVTCSAAKHEENCN